MDQTIVQQVKLENGQTLTIKDLSRKISEDSLSGGHGGKY